MVYSPIRSVEKQSAAADKQSATIIHFTPEDISTTPEKIAHYLGGNRYKMGSWLRELLPAAVDQAVRLVTPVLIYALHQVNSLSPGGWLNLANGLSLVVPPEERDTRTRYVAASVCSLGSELEKTCRELSSTGQLLRAMLLDAVGVSLLDALADKSHEQLQQKAHEMQLFAGCRFGPGYQDMPMETQTILFQLVDPSMNQVRLNESMAMHPLKSLSFFVRFSAERSHSGNFSKCRRCTMKHCQFRVNLLSNG